MSIELVPDMAWACGFVTGEGLAEGNCVGFFSPAGGCLAGEGEGAGIGIPGMFLCGCCGEGRGADPSTDDKP
jgi:hypothetical protein